MPTSPRPPRGMMRSGEPATMARATLIIACGTALPGNVLFVAVRPRMSTLADKRFVLVTGKGGVGKTTVCAAEALALAAKGKRVLVAMCNAKERLSVMLGTPPIGHDVARVADDVWAVNIEPERALEEYGTIVLHSRALYKTLFDNRYVRAFLRAVPGMHEWAMLGKAWWHTTETRADGSFKYDVVLLDAPATGHGLDMLRVPKVILDVVPPGLLQRDAEAAWALFQDAKTSAVVLVTLPEEMPTTETIEFARALTEMGLPIGRIVVNGVLPPLFSREERELLAGIGALGDGPGDAALAAARDRAIRERVQAESLNRLSRELPTAAAFLPLLMEDAAQPSAIRQLSKRV
jgi:anion-transporting  ArsA/GET3 family ATPase